MNDQPESAQEEASDDIQNPPRNIWGILRQLGPGLIIAGNIVGSGELIATTKTGAQAGIALLWLIIIGCLIKVFVQIELGRYTLTHGKTTLAALDTIPGPRFRVNWVVWFWMIMMLSTIVQMGGIVAGVGQALALTLPITNDYREAIIVPSEKEFQQYVKWEGKLKLGNTEFVSSSADRQQRLVKGHAWLKNRIAKLDERKDNLGTQLVNQIREDMKREGKLSQAVKDKINPTTYDEKIWCVLVTLATAALLYFGRYGLLQNLATVLVVSFSFITLGNVIALQSTAEWALTMDDFYVGISFLPPVLDDGRNSWGTALATFGIIGVGATELIAYPYWCMEKGYARYTGPRTEDASWAERAKGWMKVMQYDVFASMVIYTVATIAFFLMGVTVLHRQGLDPDGMRMVSTLAEAYIPIFGTYAKWLFLGGAIAVLYSTFLLANAAKARLTSDWLMIGKFVKGEGETTYRKGVTFFSVLLPFLCLAVFLAGANPVTAVLIGGAAQAIMLPILGFAALYFRFRHTDARLRPSLFQDVMLFISFIGFLLAGGYGVWSQVEKYLAG